VIENTVETEDAAGRLGRETDALGRKLESVGQFFSDRVLSPIGARISRLAPVAEETKNCATRMAKGSKDVTFKAGGVAKDVAMTAGSAAKDLAVRAGGTAKEVIGDGLAAGHRVVRKIPGVSGAEDMVAEAVKGIPDRLNLVRADDIADLKQSVDSLNRQIDRLVKKTSA